jgi:hypothetical protein
VASVLLTFGFFSSREDFLGGRTYMARDMLNRVLVAALLRCGPCGKAFLARRTRSTFRNARVTTNRRADKKLGDISIESSRRWEILAP